MDKQRVAIIIPTLNEEGTLARVVNTIPKKYRRNIIVADCHSSDQTITVARRLGAQVVISPQRSYDHPCFLGSNLALKKNADVLVYLHAGGDDDPKEILLLLEPVLKGEADLVMGSRTKSDEHSKSLHKHQKFGTQLVIKIINLSFRTNFTDIGPFRAIRSSWYKTLDMQPTSFSFPSQMLVKTLKKGGKVAEISVASRPRIGKSKISGSVKKSLLAGRDMLWALSLILSS